jgi:hypothetical protein
MVDDEDDEPEVEEVEKKHKKQKKQVAAPVQEEKKYNPPAPRVKTKGGDYVVTTINIKDKAIVKRSEENKVRFSFACVIVS